MFEADKDVLLVASYIVPENSLLYDTLELKDGILILEQSLLQVMQNEDVYLLVCGDLNPRTGGEQQKLEEMVNYVSGSVDDGDACLGGRSKERTVNKFGKSLLNTCFNAGLYYCEWFMYR